jgi:hypothetical protein
VITTREGWLVQRKDAQDIPLENSVFTSEEAGADELQDKWRRVSRLAL